MIDARLALALDEGGFAMPTDGDIAVLRPPIDAALGDLPKARTIIVEGFKPDFDVWASRGYSVTVGIEARCAATIVCLPRAKAEARAMIARAMDDTDGPVLIDGQKNSGVDSILKEMRKRVPLSAPISKAHGKLFWCASADAAAFKDWRAGPAMTPGGFWTAPGVFSADGIDPASELLAAHLPERLGARVADLGAGWGFLSAHVLTRADVKTVLLVEADHVALECARRNVGDPRASFHWADAMNWTAPERLDCIVMNPPFHVSRAADPSLGQAFVNAAAKLLSPQGQLWMVANRHLPYEQALHARFANVFEVGGDTRFKLFHALRPKRARK
ncbi:MAG: class I SAM-dependent methyltransferase [Roseobacter sp.]